MSSATPSSCYSHSFSLGVMPSDARGSSQRWLLQLPGPRGTKIDQGPLRPSLCSAALFPAELTVVIT